MNGERTRLVVSQGLDRAATEAACDRLMRAESGTVVVHHDLCAIAEGVVHRRLRSSDAEATDILELTHGCVSCTLREDVLPLLRRLADWPDVRRILPHLNPSMEPGQVCWTLAGVMVGDTTITDLVDIEAVLAVVDEDTWLADATSEEDLADRDLGATPTRSAPSRRSPSVRSLSPTRSSSPAGRATGGPPHGSPRSSTG